MLNIRTHTYYFKNMDNEHPLKNLYKNASSVIFEDIPVYAQKGDFLTSEALSGTVRVEYEINDDWKSTTLPDTVKPTTVIWLPVLAGQPAMPLRTMPPTAPMVTPLSRLVHTLTGRTSNTLQPS